MNLVVLSGIIYLLMRSDILSITRESIVRVSVPNKISWVRLDPLVVGTLRLIII